MTGSRPLGAGALEPGAPFTEGAAPRDGMDAGGNSSRRGRRRRVAAPSGRLTLAAVVVLFVGLSLYITLTSETGTYVPDDRLESVVSPGQYLERQAYLWDDARSLGKPTSSFEFSPPSTALQAGLAEIGASPWLIERLMHALFFSLAAIGVIVFLCEFRPRVGLEHALAAFVYAFSPFTTQFLLPSGLFLYYAVAPWLAWIALRGIRGDDPWRWAAAFALAAAVGGAINAPAFGFSLLPAALTVLYCLLFERSGIGELWRWLWRAGVLSALTCSAAIVVLLSSAGEVNDNLRTTELPEVISRTSSWSESWRGLGFWLSYFLESAGGLLRPEASSYFTRPDVILATFIAPIAALVALAVTRWRHRVLFGAMLLISLVLMVGIHDEGSPFGHLLSFSFDRSDFALGFRNTYKAGAGLMLGIGVLLGVGVTSAIATAARPRGGSETAGQARLRRWGLGRVLPVFVVAGLAVASYPLWTGHLYPDSGFDDIPEYWYEAFDDLGAREQQGRVLVLPGAEDARYRWGDVLDTLTDPLSPVPALANRPLPQGTPQSADLVTAIDEYVSSPGYVPGTLGPILRRLGVRWVLLQNDLEWGSMDLPRPSAYGALRSDLDFRRVAAFGDRGENTSKPGDIAAKFLGERTLPPVELYEVSGAPAVQPRVVPPRPLLVAGAGDSWPALAQARLLGGPPVAYTGSASGEDLRDLAAAGSQLVVTDGNRRRVTATTNERQYSSPTLAANGPVDREPGDLFGGLETQSTATFRDAEWISASRYGFPLSPYEASSRPANAFDGVPRTAWTVRGPLSSDGESMDVELRGPTHIDGVSVVAQAAGPWRVRGVDVILHQEDGVETSERLTFAGLPREKARATIEADRVARVELRIADVDGPGPVGIAGVGISEVGVSTPEGPLDLREFIGTPDDVVDRAASDERLAAGLAEHPPLYELRRLTGIGSEDEETELRREITAFGDHSYDLTATARVNGRSPDASIDALLGATVGAVGSSRSGGDPQGFGGLAVDDDLSTGWEPVPQARQSLELRFPSTVVNSVQVLVVSGPRTGAARSRVTGINVAVGPNAGVTGSARLPSSTRCVGIVRPNDGCLERLVVRIPPIRTDRLSVTLRGIDAVLGPLGLLPPKVAEVRINGQGWSQLARPHPAGACAPLVAVDGRPVEVRLPDPADVLSGRLLELEGCKPVHLRPGRHRIESLPGLSGTVLTTSLAAAGQNTPPPEGTQTRDPGTVKVVDSSPTELDLRVRARRDAVLEGGMPEHGGWAADGGGLQRSIPLDTFSAWNVEAGTDAVVTLRFEPQRLYELAMALSIGAAAWCLWRVSRRRRGSPS